MVAVTGRGIGYVRVSTDLQDTSRQHKSINLWLQRHQLAPITILEDTGREPNRKALVDLLAKAQAAGVLGPGEPAAIAGEYFSLLMGDLMYRLLLGVVPRPKPKEIRKRARAATQLILALHARQRDDGK